jgi:ribonuclease R
VYKKEKKMTKKMKQAPQVLEGTVDMTQGGGAYVVVGGAQRDVFVRPSGMNGALEGDLVKVLAKPARGGGKPEGVVTEIVKRSTRAYAGVINLSPDRHYGFVSPDSRKIPYDIFVHLDEGSTVEEGAKVLVRIVEWDAGRKNPSGELVDILGMPGDNDTEMHSILAEFDLPYKFEQEVLDDAERIPGKITAKEIAARRDMRTVATFTIDPADAKDFDDALSVRRLPAGWEVGVHIADVTHYVQPKTVVEREAEDRATSVYLVDRTIPMLPERLSNDLCSLRPNEDKLTFSAVFELDDEANIIKEWFGRTVIHSDRRFAYEEAQAVIEGNAGDMKDEILTLHTLAQKLRARRFKNGSITFEREEAKFTLDASGKPTGVYFKEQKESNQLIEEFMLLANRRVAEFVAKQKKTMVYRVHDEPNADKLASFSRFITRFGYDFRAQEGKAISKEMNRLMKQIHGKAEENIVSTLAIRTMAKAFYTTDNIGHYGLAFKYYTHFTSPIRRYPDMMVHRLLATYLEGSKAPDKNSLEELCEHSSDMEIRAAEAERASVKYKMVEFMLDKLGQEFDGTISGITEWGIYVELTDTHIEGMVSLRDMTDDYYTFDEENYMVEGRLSRRRFTLGDGVRVRVLRADLARKQLDFQLTASYDFHTGKATAVERDAPRERPSTRTRTNAKSAPKGASHGKQKGRKRR